MSINSFYASQFLGYSQSKIPVSIYLHCAEETTFSEDEINGSYLEYFRRSKGTVRALRNTADSAVLLVTHHPVSSLCGKSYLGRKSVLFPNSL